MKTTQYQGTGKVKRLLLSKLDILVYTSIYKVRTLFTTTLHLESGLICLAPPSSLNCTLVPFIPVGLLASFSRLN